MGGAAIVILAELDAAQRTSLGYACIFAALTIGLACAVWRGTRD